MSAVSIDLTIRTPRLELHFPRESDALRIAECCGPREMARMMLRVPHPYPPGAAEEFICGARERWEKGTGYCFLGAKRDTGRIVVCAGLEVAPQHHHAELGYWVAMEEWGKGYATESSAAILDFGFTQLGLRRIHAGHYAHNPASGRVLAKLGFQVEGLRPQHICRLGEFVDLVEVGLLAEDWKRGNRQEA